MGLRPSTLEREGNAIRLQILQMPGLRIEDVQLLSKCNQVQVGEFFAVCAEFAVQVLPVGDELFDEVLHIHNRASILDSHDDLYHISLVLLSAAFFTGRPRKNPGLINPRRHGYT
jgi:hypothetical protein